MPAPVAQDDAVRLAADLSVLAEPHRLIVLSHLRGGPRSAGELARSSNMAPSLASHHLAVLLRAGMVTRRRQGSFVYYALERAKVTDLNQQLNRLTKPGSKNGKSRSPG